MENERNPWEAIKEEGENQSPEAIAQKQKAEKTKETSALIGKIISWVLLISVVLGISYAIFVHPVHKLNLSLFLGRSYEMEIVAPTGRHTTIKVDGNLISVKEGSYEEIYYETDGENFYIYRRDASGKWVRKKTAENALVIGSSSGNDFSLDVLFDRRNYEKAKGKPGVWRIKDGVNKGGFDVIEFQHLLTQYKITAHKGYVYDNWSSYAYMTITIDHIGTTKITPPWEK